jgi:hypothetical protein
MVLDAPGQTRYRREAAAAARDAAPDSGAWTRFLPAQRSLCSCSSRCQSIRVNTYTAARHATCTATK